MPAPTSNAVMTIESIPGPATVKTPPSVDDIVNGIWLSSVGITASQIGEDVDDAASQANLKQSRHVDIEPLMIIKQADRASTALFTAMLSRRRFPKITITLLRPDGIGGKEYIRYLEILLGRASIRSVNMQASEGSGAYVTMTEQLLISYRTIQLRYLDEEWAPGSNAGTYESGTWDQNLGGIV